MSSDPKDNLFPTAIFVMPRTETVEMTEIDGMEQRAVLRFTNIGRPGQLSKAREINACYSDMPYSTEQCVFCGQQFIL